MAMTALVSLAGERTVIRGVKFIDKPMVITPADSGREFVGEDGAVICGGVRLGPWQRGEDGAWVADAPKAEDGSPMYFSQLWANGRRAQNARVPAEGYLHITNAVEHAVTNDAGRVLWVEKTTLVDDGEVARLAALNPDDLRQMAVGLITKWSYALRAVKGYSAATRTLTTVGATPWREWKKWEPKSTTVEFFNVRSAFDAPGEWYADRDEGKVYYRPLPGEDMAKIEIYVPRYGLSKLVELRGEPQHGKWVENVTFRNIAFENSSFTITDPSLRGLQPLDQYQAAIGSDGAVSLSWARNCRFENCRVAHTGNYGMRFGDACVSNSVIDCTLEDLGAGGIWMGEKFMRVPVRRQVNLPTNCTSVAFNLVSNCTIRAAGKHNPEGTGVVLAHCSDSKVVNCDIYDILYTGVSVGWTWGFAGSVAQRNEIAFNRIYNLGQGIMSDLGGVYTLGTSFGTRVHDNIIHDVKSYDYGGWALYCDEGSEGVVMERNLCWNTTDGGFHQHYGTGNIIRNNIFLWNRLIGAVRTYRDIVQDIPCTLNFLNNIIVVREGALASKGVRKVGGVWANNLWWDVRGEAAAKFDELSWAEWRECGHELGGVFADPCFVDLDGGDYRLKPDSPAFRLGFRSWDYSKAGVRAK